MEKDPQIERFKSMTPSEKFAAMVKLYNSARELKAAAYRNQHPEWSEEEVKEAVRKCFLYART